MTREAKIKAITVNGIKLINARTMNFRFLMSFKCLLVYHFIHVLVTGISYEKPPVLIPVPIPAFAVKYVVPPVLCIGFETSRPA